MTPAPINYEKWIPHPKTVRGLIGAIATRCREAGCTYQALGELKPTKVLWPYPTRLPSTLDGFCTHPRISIPASKMMDVATEAEHWWLKAREGVNDKLLKDISVIVGKDVSSAFTAGHCDENLFLVELLLVLIPSCRSFTLDDKNFYLRIGSTHKTDVVGFFDNKAFGRKVDVRELTKSLTQIEYWEATGFGLMERLWLWVHASKVRDKPSVLATLASLKLTQVGDWAVLLDESTFGLHFDTEVDLKRIQRRRVAKFRAVPKTTFRTPVDTDQLPMEYTFDEYDEIRATMRSPGELAEKFQRFYEFMVPNKVDDKRFRLMFYKLPSKTLTVFQEEKIWQGYVRFEKRLEQFLGLKK